MKQIGQSDQFGRVTGDLPGNQSERVELILQQLRTLPTLSPIATRLLDLTADDQADIREIIRLIESDPALTAKVLSLCRRADKGLGDRITTVDRAVVMIGFDAIRNAVLSVEIYNLFAPSEDDDELVEPLGSTSVSDESGTSAFQSAASTGFDRIEFWKHCLGVAVTAETLADLASTKLSVSPSEAFVCGLLHGIGKLALDRVLPRSYARIAEIADREMGNIAEIERKILGVDHHTVGKRLGELWGLPFVIQDVMWLYGQPFESLPELPHRKMIGLVSLADCITRAQHIGRSGNHMITADFNELCQVIGVDRRTIDEAVPRIHEKVGERAKILGLGEIPVDRLFLESIACANITLGRINENLEHKTRQMARHEQILRAISEFHQLASPGQSVLTVCGHVVASASREFGQGFYAMLVPTAGTSQWRICQFGNDGRLLRSEIIDPPGGTRALQSLADDYQVSVEIMGLLPCISDCLGDARDIRDVRLLPLRNGWGLPAVLLHDRNLTESGLKKTVLRSLCETWASAIAAAAQHDGARRLGEQLAEANRRLTETQAKLERSRVMAALGELAAGAAHEMNNPLTVISGRSQVLASQIDSPKHRRMAEQIVEQSHRLSDLITSLHIFADPPQPKPYAVNLTHMIGRVVKSACIRCNTHIPINVSVSESPPRIFIDGEQVGLALMELIVNALQANPKKFVDVEAKTTSSDDRLIIMVKDDGDGMDDHALAHAFDPFFSKKPAGRQPGLGLARAQQLITAQRGVVELTSLPGKGTTASIKLPLEIGDELTNQQPPRPRESKGPTPRPPQQAA